MLRICVVIIRLNGTMENHAIIVIRIGSVQTERGESMALSNYEWIIVHNDGETEKVEADSIYDVVDHCTNDEQPIAILRGELKW